jgi:hypothetical protein
MDPIAKRVAARFMSRRIQSDDEHGRYHTHVLEDPRIPKLERLLGSVGRELHQMDVSLGQYKHDPAKYAPQLENLANAAGTAMAALTVVLRTV